MAAEARVPILDIERATGEAARFFEATAALRGRVPNSSRVWGHIPAIAQLQLPAGVALQREGAGGVLSCRIKEMAVLRTSHVNTCNY
jgi:hypothetical protein